VDNHSIIGRCLQNLKVGLSEFLSSHFPGEKVDDVSNSLKLIAFRWNEIDADIPRKARALAHEMIDVRNEWAHQVPFSDDDTIRALDTAARLLSSLGEMKSSEEVKTLQSSVGQLHIERKTDRTPRIIKVDRSRSALVDRSADCCNQPLINIAFSTERGTASYTCLMERLASISYQVFGTIERKQGPISRHYIPLKFGWVNETRIEPVEHDSKQYLQVLFHIGDTKQQGELFFNFNPNGVSWPSSVARYQLIVQPYIKIGNPYSRTILWIRPSETESSNTHSLRFFNDFAGEVRRDDWEQFGDRLSQFVPNWKENCFARDSDRRVDWHEKITATGYQTIRVSAGTNLSILIPYAECRQMDTDLKNSRVASTYQDIIKQIKEIVEKPVTDRMK